jgi:hypothetical protein
LGFVLATIGVVRLDRFVVCWFAGVQAYVTRHGYTAPSEFGVLMMAKYCISEGGETVSRSEVR